MPSFLSNAAAFSDVRKLATVLASSATSGLRVPMGEALMALASPTGVRAGVLWAYNGRCCAAVAAASLRLRCLRRFECRAHVDCSCAHFR